MNREIKFRAWDSLEKRIVYGEEIEIKTQCDNTQVYHAGLSYGDLFVGRFDDKLDWHELPVMQWTGLTDKNENPVFEGDIIKVRVNFHFWVYKIGTVEGQGSNLYAIEVYDNCSVEDDTNIYTYKIQTIRAGKWRPVPHNCEVIGNIYQDSHLLEAPQ